MAWQRLRTLHPPRRLRWGLIVDQLAFRHLCCRLRTSPELQRSLRLRWSLMVDQRARPHLPVCRRLRSAPALQKSLRMRLSPMVDQPPPVSPAPPAPSAGIAAILAPAPALEPDAANETDGGFCRLCRRLCSAPAVQRSLHQ